MKELYLEMGVYAFLNIFKAQFYNKEGIIVTAIAFAAMIWIVIFPIIVFNLIQSNAHRLRFDTFKERMNSLVEGTEI